MSRAAPASSAGLRAVLRHVPLDRLALAAAGALSLVEVAGSLGFPLLTRSIVDRAGSGDAAWQGPALVLALVLLAAAVASAVARFLTARSGLALEAALKAATMDRLVRAPIAYFDDASSGAVTSRVVNDTKAVAQIVSREGLAAASAALLLVGAAVVLFATDARLAGILFGAVALAFLAMLPVVLTTARITTRTQDETARLSGRLTQIFAEIRMVKTFGAEAREQRSIAADVASLFALGCRSARIEAALSPIVTLSVTLAMVTILAYGGMRVAAGSLSSGTLTAFLLYIFTVVGPLAQLTAFVSRLSAARGASARLLDVLDLPAEAEGADRAGMAAVPGLPQALTFEGIRFAYAADAEGTGTTLAIDRIVFAPGTRTALIGPSGSGKSTLLALIERFYAPDRGVIRYGGQDIAALPLAQWRARIGYVAQSTPMVSGSIRDNLLYGIDRPVGEQQIADALVQSRSAGFVAALPEGLNTPVGERGVLLSGGERQRIAIARMFLRDPEILLLDEATSSLDEENAHLVLQGLDMLMRGRTCILVTHRMSGLETMDQIVSLDAGRIVECGTPDALLSGVGLYRRFAHRQFTEEKIA